jgi:hypothetical protein
VLLGAAAAGVFAASASASTPGHVKRERRTDRPAVTGPRTLAEAATASA